LKDSKEPAILLDNVRDGIIRDSRATDGTNIFIHVQGDKSDDIVLRNNNTKKAKEVVTFEKENLRKVVESN